jgi:hypothetical protein
MHEKVAAMVLADAALPPGVFRQEELDALIALRGQQLPAHGGRDSISVVERAIGGVAMAATAGVTLPRHKRPFAQRTTHVHALVDSGCNQHLLKDLSLFVTLDRKRAMQPFTVASDRTTVPQGYGTDGAIRCRG